MDPTEENRAVVRAFVRAVNEQDWPVMEGLVEPDFVRHSEAAGEPPVRSREELVDYLVRQFEMFPDASETLEDMIAEGDRIAARHRFTATHRGFLGSHPPTGRRLEATYLAIYRIEGGRLAEAWVEWDNLHALRELGLWRSGRSAEVGG